VSWRERLFETRSSVVPGDVVQLFRDNDTRTYRVFTVKGYRNVKIIGSHSGGYTMDSCKNCDFSIEDFRELAAALNKAVTEHEPWPEREP